MTLALIPLFPLASFVILILAGRRLGKFSAVIALEALLGSLLISAFLFNDLRMMPAADRAVSTYFHQTWAWLPFGQASSLKIGFLLDPLSAVMCLVVTVIGWFIMLYSIGYMGEDPRFSRFFAYLSLFFSAMLTLVLADNLILLYIGWEGVGLCSYLLISFWFERTSAANAGKKAFLTTRVGDLGLLLGILLIAKLTGHVDFTGIQINAPFLGAWTTAAALLLFWGAAGKSAQFPLHVWLPDAMEGPTPVSALIHAATMVAAGIYLVARMLPLFLLSPDALLVVGAIAAITSFFAATIACTQTDLKRILAYSTISQLGFMMMGLAAGSAGAGMFHLVTHAWFKALLFLGAGSVIHSVHHQEITRMGGLWRSMPVTALTFAAAAITMAGIPPFSGFWSKEEILMSIAQFSHPRYPWAGSLLFWTALATAGLTAFYITRATLLTFAGKPKDPHAHPRSAGAPGEVSSNRSQESPPIMTGPLLFLSVGALGIGLIGTSWTGHWFQNFLAAEGVQHLGHAGAGHSGAGWIPLASIAAAVGGIGLAVLRSGLGLVLLPAGIRSGFSWVYRLAFNKYYIDELYDLVLIRPLLALSRTSFRFDGEVIDRMVNDAGRYGLSLSAMKGWVDRVIVDGMVNGVATAAGRAGAALRLIQTGLVQNYLLIAASGTITLFLVLRWIH